VPRKNLVGLAVPSDTTVPMIFSQIHQDNHYKRLGARPITKMKTGQPDGQKLAWGRPHFQSRKVCPSKLLFNILFIYLNKGKIFASPMFLKFRLYAHFGNDEWSLS
jgi:hypothetical protein